MKLITEILSLHQLNILFDEVLVWPDNICKLTQTHMALHSATNAITRTFSVTSSKKIPPSIHSKVSFVMAKVGSSCNFYNESLHHQLSNSIWSNLAKFVWFGEEWHSWIHAQQCYNVSSHWKSHKKFLILEYYHLNSEQ